MLKQVHISYMLPVNPDLLKQIKYVCMYVLIKDVTEQGFFTFLPRGMKLSVCETQESGK